MENKELFGFSPEVVDLIRKTVGKDAANEDEFKRFLYRANKLGLNPLDGTIHLVARNRKVANGWEKTNTIIIGIDGFRAIADRSGKLAGIRRDVIYDENGRLVRAWAEVYRKDWEHPAREVVSLREYCQTKDGRPTGQWAVMPEAMLKKCAEAGAHRMAFASELAGIYIPEEISEESQDEANVNPEPNNGAKNHRIKKTAQQQTETKNQAAEKQVTPPETTSHTESKPQQQAAPETKQATPPDTLHESKPEQQAAATAKQTATPETVTTPTPEPESKPEQQTNKKTSASKPNDNTIPFEGQIIVVGEVRSEVMVDGSNSTSAKVFDPVSEEELLLIINGKHDLKPEELLDVKGYLDDKVLVVYSIKKVCTKDEKEPDTTEMDVVVTLAHKMFNDVINGVKTPIAWIKGKGGDREIIIMGYGQNFDPVSKLEVGQTVKVTGTLEQKKGAECLIVNSVQVIA